MTFVRESAPSASDVGARRHVCLMKLQNDDPKTGRQAGRAEAAHAPRPRQGIAQQKRTPKTDKLKAAPLQQGQRSGFGHQYLRLRAASAFFLRFTLGFS